MSKIVFDDEKHLKESKLEKEVHGMLIEEKERFEKGNTNRS